MKAGKAKAKTAAGAGVKATQWMLALLIIFLCVGATAFLWVFVSAKTQTIQVCMWEQNHAKNSPVTTDAVVPYDMLLAEYETYAVQGTDGVTSRIIKWEDRALLNGRYCTRNVYGATIVMIDDLMDKKINNKDMLLYNFPGREIVSLEIGSSDMEAFKSFLVPGDRINITAVIKSEKIVDATTVGDETSTSTQTATDLFNTDSKSNKNQEVTEEVITTEPLFDSIYIADMLNKDGESVLDLMERYNSMTATQQAQLANSDSWKEQTKPETLLIALTKEELLRYYKYAQKDGVTFRVSLPQR